MVTIFLMTGCGEKGGEKKGPAQTSTPQETSQPTSFVLGDGNTSIQATIGDEGIDFNVSEPVVMLDFFATWCPPCRAEIPHLADLQKKYEGKLKIVGVLVETKDRAAVERFKQGFGINYLVSNAKDNMTLADRVMQMLHQPRNFSIPFMVLFVKGKYFRHYVGLVPEEMLESDIKEALKGVK